MTDSEKQARNRFRKEQTLLKRRLKRRLKRNLQIIESLKNLIREQIDSVSLERIEKAKALLDAITAVINITPYTMPNKTDKTNPTYVAP